MEIGEAIEHAKQVFEGCPAEDRDCAYQHDKLVDWLTELRAYRDTGLTPEGVKNLQADYIEIANRYYGTRKEGE